MKTIWFCGNDENTLTSIAELVGEELINRDKNVELIVESEVRKILGRGLKDTPEDRSTFTDRLGFLGNLLHRNNIFALIVSKDAPLNDRKAVKENYKNYLQVNTGTKDELTDLVLENTNDLKSNAKKIIEHLIKERIVCKESQEVYSQEEEEEIRKRLEDLGYV